MVKLVISSRCTPEVREYMDATIRSCAKDKRDVYKVLAAQELEIAYEEVTPQQRQYIKTQCHRLMYSNPEVEL